MPTKIIIARHGNTFTSDQTPTRVGARTDLPLVASGEEQARRLGLHFKDKNLLPDVIYTSTLQRTIKTARIACDVMGCDAPHTALPCLNEIDYGPDDNKPEPEVRGRLGEIDCGDEVRSFGGAPTFNEVVGGCAFNCVGEIALDLRDSR